MTHWTGASCAASDVTHDRAGVCLPLVSPARWPVGESEERAERGAGRGDESVLPDCREGHMPATRSQGAYCVNNEVRHGRNQAKHGTLSKGDGRALRTLSTMPQEHICRAPCGPKQQATVHKCHCLASDTRER